MTRQLFLIPIILIIYSNGFCQDGKSKNIAVLDIEITSGISDSYQRPLTDRLRQEILSTGAFTVVERNVMVEILEEQGFQLAGCTTNDCAVEAGKLLGVECIIAGSIGKVGYTHTINLRMISVESSEILKSKSFDCICAIGYGKRNRARVAIEYFGGGGGKDKVLVGTIDKRFFSIFNVHFSPQIGAGYNFEGQAANLRYVIFGWEVDLSDNLILRLSSDHDRNMDLNHTTDNWIIQL
ncbi:MAG: CsgG/HfaB family protein [Candidatus Electryonea clarkiae]|nr:CsgG/HfaB family protein [Candidatus Electryonea clarkiae]MDP8286729.1 CsgG/HfaB family protein [Candidatus Electryonea clarkiae]